ncbi:MAG TPA: hypothetical protein PLL99_06540, partial [Chitinophagales bacterium]|nr:hypothetical protein [Chitinophagales bacterium]
MKKIFITGLLALTTFGIFAQQETSTTVKEPLRLKIRKNVLRPLGKDWYISLSAGYGIPFMSTNKRSPLKQIGDKDWYQHGKEL